MAKPLVVHVSRAGSGCPDLRSFLPFFFKVRCISYTDFWYSGSDPNPQRTFDRDKVMYLLQVTGYCASVMLHRCTLQPPLQHSLMLGTNSRSHTKAIVSMRACLGKPTNCMADPPSLPEVSQDDWSHELSRPPTQKRPPTCRPQLASPRRFSLAASYMHVSSRELKVSASAYK